MNPTTGIDINDPKYKCCCSYVHVKHGTLAIGIFMILLATGRFYQAYSHATDSQLRCMMREGCASSPAFLWLSVIFGAIALLIVVILLIGICTQKANLLFPFMVFLIITMVGSVILGVAVFFAGDNVLMLLGGTEGRPYNRSDVSQGQAIVVSSVGIALGVLLWWLWVVYKCKRFFHDLAAARGIYAPGIPYQPPKGMEYPPAAMYQGFPPQQIQGYPQQYHAFPLQHQQSQPPPQEYIPQPQENQIPQYPYPPQGLNA